MTPQELRARRLALGYTQAELGGILWKSRAGGQVTLSKLEDGTRRITRLTAAWLDAELTRLEWQARPLETRR
jgi:hypothetical protein